MWDPPGPGLEPVSPALAGGLLTTAPPGKPLNFFKKTIHLVTQHQSLHIRLSIWKLSFLSFFSFSLGLVSQNSERTVIWWADPSISVMLINHFLLPGEGYNAHSDNSIVIMQGASKRLIHNFCLHPSWISSFLQALKSSTVCYYFSWSCLKRSIHPTERVFACKRQTWQENVEKTQSEFKWWDVFEPQLFSF